MGRRGELDLGQLKAKMQMLARNEAFHPSEPIMWSISITEVPHLDRLTFQ